MYPKHLISRLLQFLYNTRLSGRFFILAVAVAMILSVSQLQSSTAQGVYYSTSTTSWVTTETRSTTSPFTQLPLNVEKLIQIEPVRVTTGLRGVTISARITNLSDKFLRDVTVSVAFRYRDGKTSEPMSISLGDFEPHQSKTMEQNVRIRDIPQALLGATGLSTVITGWPMQTITTTYMGLTTIIYAYQTTYSIQTTSIYDYQTDRTQTDGIQTGGVYTYLTIIGSIMVAGIILTVAYVVVASRRLRGARSSTLTPRETTTIPQTASANGKAVQKQAEEPKDLKNTYAYCIHCATQIPQNATFCSRCGRRQK